MDTSPLKAIELVVDIDETHLLKAKVPDSFRRSHASYLPSS
jgi:hypothetical protein